MKKTIITLVVTMASVICSYAQEKLQIVFLNKDARTFVHSGNGWTLAGMDTPITASTVFKNYSDPPSRIVIRDWEKGMQYEIRLDQEECALSDVLASAERGGLGSPVRFIARKIEASHAIHYSRSAAAMVQRGSSSEAQHGYAKDVIAALLSSDGLFHLDSLSHVSAAYPAAISVNDDGSLVMSNYSDMELYFTPLLMASAPSGKKTVAALCPDDFYLLPPDSEQSVTPQSVDCSGKTILLFATEQFIDPYILSVRLRKADNKKVERKAPCGSGVFVLGQ